MESQPPTASRPVVEILEPPLRRRWLGLGRRRIKLPQSAADSKLILMSQTAAGEFDLQPIPPDATGSLETDDARAQLIRYRTSTQTLRLEFARVAKDTHGHAHDLVLHGTWKVTDVQEFFRAGVQDLVSANMPLTGGRAVSWMEETLLTSIRDQVRRETSKCSLEEIREKNILPQTWWEKQIARWLDGRGLQVSIARAGWESEDANRFRAEQLRQQETARMADEQRRERELELRNLQEEQKYEDRRAELAQSQSIDSAQRQHELQLLALDHEKERGLRESELDEIRCRREKAALAHELELARLRRDEENAAVAEREALEQMRRLEQSHADLASQHEQVLKTLERLADLPELLSQMVSADSGQQHTSAERLVHEFEIPGDVIASLGHEAVPQQFVEFVTRKVQQEGRTVGMKMPELVTRDIVLRDIGPKKVDSLPIDGSLHFDLTSPLSGYVTLLNFGTSGNIWLHVPNLWVTASQAVIEANRPYHIPGPPLLPLPPEMVYIEGGPVGRENMVLIVTEQPLVGPELAGAASAGMPFAQVSSANLDQLYRQLTGQDDANWAAGVLSFRVE